MHCEWSCRWQHLFHFHDQSGSYEGDTGCVEKAKHSWMSVLACLTIFCRVFDHNVIAGLTRNLRMRSRIRSGMTSSKKIPLSLEKRCLFDKCHWLVKLTYNVSHFNKKSICDKIQMGAKWFRRGAQNMKSEPRVSASS